ncbi:hypothetical protein RirG_188120 [Rhizophagus irregularis DAOM 197198w]|uniref:Uncharacterized protein n=1 Tax=Rhizophagus irregularis (strain DAOM 197198w) TaxID=1432141 RepID=A0A015LXZ5_RHIIW|nr:hypothetical protein RirG_188120 [Rhizophagus irregularis DAOM 197198w]
MRVKVVPLLFRDPLPLRLCLNDVSLKDVSLMFHYQVRSVILQNLVLIYMRTLVRFHSLPR